MEKQGEFFLERVTGLCRRTREEIVKWNQMTALRFLRGGGDIRHSLPPFGGLKETFTKRYIDERTSKAEMRSEEQSEKAGSFFLVEN